MRPPVIIKPYLSRKEMFLWLQQAPDSAAYRRRLAISLTDAGKLHAEQVATVLGASVQAVRLWIKQYNNLGPEGLERLGRGGRRWAFLNQSDEIALIKQARVLAVQRNESVAVVLQEIVSRKLGKSVSRSYAYRLLARNGGIRRSRPTENQELPTTVRPNHFLRQVQPWKRKQ